MIPGDAIYFVTLEGESVYLGRNYIKKLCMKTNADNNVLVCARMDDVDLHWIVSQQWAKDIHAEIYVG